MENRQHYELIQEKLNITDFEKLAGGDKKLADELRREAGIAMEESMLLSRPGAPIVWKCGRFQAAYVQEVMREVVVLEYLGNHIKP